MTERTRSEEVMTDRTTISVEMPPRVHAQSSHEFDDGGRELRLSSPKNGQLRVRTSSGDGGDGPRERKLSSPSSSRRASARLDSARSRSSRSTSNSGSAQLSPPSIPPTPTSSSGSSTRTFIRHPTPVNASQSTNSSAFDSLSTLDEASWEEDSLTAYRERVRPKVGASYNGRRHLLWLLGASALGTALPLFGWLGSEGASWKELAAVAPAGLLYANLLEYTLHRFAGHGHPRGDHTHGGHTHGDRAAAAAAAGGCSIRLRRRLMTPLATPLRAFRFYHAAVHHSFFHGGGEAMDAEEEADLFFILFPTWVYVGWLICGFAPLLAPAGWFLANAGASSAASVGSDGKAAGSAVMRVLLLVMACASFSLLQYEVLHAFHHGALPPPLQAALERIPALRLMRRRHRIHHGGGGGRSGGCCFNITWPLSDALFGTLASVETDKRCEKS